MYLRNQICYRITDCARLAKRIALWKVRLGDRSDVVQVTMECCSGSFGHEVLKQLIARDKVGLAVDLCAGQRRDPLRCRCLPQRLMRGENRH